MIKNYNTNAVPKGRSHTQDMAYESLQMGEKVSQFDSCQVVDASRRLLGQSH